MIRIDNGIIAPQRFGRHKINRFLYHFTTKEKYDNMLKDGFIKQFDDFDMEGIYMVDLPNFTKRWRWLNDWKEHFLSFIMLKHVSYAANNVVALKIPTDKLDHNSLLTRSINRCYSYNVLKRIDNLNHCVFGDEARFSSLYKKRKEAVEYIYQNDIPIEDVEFVGKADVNWKSASKDIKSINDEKNCIRSILSCIFANRPEMKNIEHL